MFTFLRKTLLYKFLIYCWQILFGKKLAEPELSTEAIVIQAKPGISFSIQNPGTTPPNQPELYLKESNQLNFLFSNTLGIPNVNPGDVFMINIPDNLISSASEDQLLSKDWKVQQVTQKNDFYSYNLTPLKQLDFSGTITIILQKLMPPAATNGDVITSFSIGGGSVDDSREKLFATEKTNSEAKRLQDFITIPSTPFINEKQQIVARGTVYTSPTAKVAGQETLQPPVSNEIHINLKYNGSRLVENWNNSKTPRFMFSFAYGSQSMDLTDVIKAGQNDYNPFTSAWNIKAEIGDDESNQWQLQALNVNSSTPVWVVEPTLSNQYLFTNNEPNLDLVFTHVISALATGGASLFVQWTNIPGFNDGRQLLDLPKQLPQPKVINFTSSSDGFTAQEPVLLNWQTFGTSELELSWNNSANNSGKIPLAAYPSNFAPGLIYDGNNQVAGGYAAPPFQATDTSYACTLSVPGQEHSGQQLTFSLKADTAPVIDQFKVDLTVKETGSMLTVSWLINSDNVNLYCEFSGLPGRLPLKGENGNPYTHFYTIDAGSPLPSEFKLTVKGFFPEISTTLNLEYKTVQTIKGGTVLSMSPDLSKIFISKNDNRLYYANPLSSLDSLDSLDSLGALDQFITVGTESAKISDMYISPLGKQAFAFSIDEAEEKETLYYFDAAKPPEIAVQTIDLNGYGFLSTLPLSSTVVFSEDGSKVFFCGIKKKAPVAISYFDPHNPPAKLPQQIKFPAGEFDDSLGIFMHVVPTKMEALTFLLPLNANPAPATTPLYSFDISNPPALLENPASFDLAAFLLQISPDGQTVFSMIPGANDNIKIGYFPVSAPPSKVSHFLQIPTGTTAMRIHPENGLLYTVSDKISYFNWKKPAEPVLGTIAIPKAPNEVDIVYTRLSPNNDYMLMTDINNNSFCYFNVNNPPEIINATPVGSDPYSMFCSADGLRIFVNNGLLSNTGSISVLEAYYE